MDSEVVVGMLVALSVAVAGIFFYVRRKSKAIEAVFKNSQAIINSKADKEAIDSKADKEAIDRIEAVFKNNQAILDSKADKDAIDRIEADLHEMKMAQQALSDGQARMYEDFTESMAETVNKAIQPLIDSNARQCARIDEQNKRIDRMMELQIAKK